MIVHAWTACVAMRPFFVGYRSRSFYDERRLYGGDGFTVCGTMLFLNHYSRDRSLLRH
jgi:hypothetical protein